MDIAALILMILALIAFIPWPTHPLPGWGMVLLTAGFICQFTHITGDLIYNH